MYIINYYLKNGLRLTPIKPGTKRPIPKNWTVNTITTPEQVKQYPGHGFGWVLDAGHLVVDVDPRNNGKTGLRLLSETYKRHAGKKLTDEYPIVKTPSGGCHVYMTKPKDLKTSKICHAYPGVDFLSVGAQCLTAGSEHPNGGIYDFLTNGGKPPQPAPEWLLRELEKQVDAPTNMTGSAERAFTRSQIKGMLEQLDVTEFRNNTDWLQVMQAVHESSKGDDLDLFLDWSLSDPMYSGDTEVITLRWRSHKPGKAGNVQPGTLVALVNQSGGSLPAATADEEAEQIPSLPNDLPGTVGEILNDGRDRQKCPVSYIEDQITKTTNWSGQKTMIPLIKLLLPHPWAERRRLIAKIARASGYQVADVRDLLLKTAGETTQKSDPGIEIVELTLSKYFDSEDRVVNAADQKFWIFRKTHWHPMPKNIMLQYIMQSADFWQVRHPENRSAVSTLMGQAERIMIARLASEIDLNSKQPPANVINVQNGELYFDSENGTYEIKPHDPGNFHTSCLNVKWDPKAKCDRFDRFLLEVFDMSPNPEELIRHLWELIGYTMQGRKNLASWILLTGEGANGKTTLLKALTALLGAHAQNASVTEIAGNPHGINDLVGKLALIDEDLSSKYKLPDSFLKKISENKQMRANPKYETPFNFENRAIVWMATNVLPATDDVSHGMIRRAHVLHFGRKFLDHEQDKTLDATFAGPELSGIFRRAVEGLCRLRKRGQWDTPREIRGLIKSWSTQASPLALWHHECIRAVKKQKKSYVALKDLYNHYVLWCDDQNLKYTYSKPMFRKKLASVGVDFARVSGNILVAKDLRIVTEDELITKGL